MITKAISLVAAILFAVFRPKTKDGIALTGGVAALLVLGSIPVTLLGVLAWMISAVL
jgi:hypothetical protein